MTLNNFKRWCSVYHGSELALTAQSQSFSLVFKLWQVDRFGKIHGMTSSPNRDQMTPEQLRSFAAQLLSKVHTMGRKIHRDETIIEQLSHEIAILKRHKFAKRSEQISPEQGSAG